MLDASRCSWRLHLWPCQSFLVVSVADVVVAAVVAARRTLESFDPNPSPPGSKLLYLVFSKTSLPLLDLQLRDYTLLCYSLP